MGQYNQPEPIFWASGAALFIRSRLFHEMGGLDTYFFAHQEEIDLCWRLQLAGYTIYSCPQSVVYHVGGGTLPKAPGSMGLENTFPFRPGFYFGLEVAFCRGRRLFCGHPGSASGLSQMGRFQAKTKHFPAKKKRNAAWMVYGEHCLAVLCDGKENFYRNCKA